jgi:hypothetical protein
LQRWRDVEHHDVLIMMGKNAGIIMPADSIRPRFDQRFDLGLGRLALLHHGSRSEVCGCALRTNVGAHIRHAKQLFLARACKPTFQPPGPPLGSEQPASSEAINQELPHAAINLRPVIGAGAPGRAARL